MALMPMFSGRLFMLANLAMTGCMDLNCLLEQEQGVVSCEARVEVCGLLNTRARIGQGSETGIGLFPEQFDQTMHQVLCAVEKTRGVQIAA